MLRTVLYNFLLCLRANIVCLLSFLLFLSISTGSYAQLSNKGKDFYVVFTENNNSLWASPIRLIISITSDKDASGTISYPTYPGSPNNTVVNFSVKAGEFYQHYIDDTRDNKSLMTNSQNRSNIYRRGIRIQSDTDVSVYAQNFQKFWNAITLVFPNKSLGNEYIVSGFEPELRGDSGEFSIVGIEDNTVVEFTPTLPDVSGKYFAYNTYTIRLNKGEVFTYYVSNSYLYANNKIDFSGSHIKAEDCKKVGVYVGYNYVQTPCKTFATPSSGDNFFQQLPSSDTWGKSYIVAPLINREGYIVRVFGLKGKTTTLTINNSKRTLNSSNNYYTEYYTSNPVVVKSSLPVMVVQYMLTDNCDENYYNLFYHSKYAWGDPFLVVQSPLSQKVNDVTFYSSKANSLTQYSNITDHFVNVVIQNKFIDSFKLNGQRYSNDFVSIPNTDYSYLQKDLTSRVNNGNKHVSFAEAEEGFQIVAYGAGEDESYGYLAGAQLDKNNIDIYLYDGKQDIKKNDFIYCSKDQLDVIVESNSEIGYMTFEDSTLKSSTTYSENFWKTENDIYFYKIPLDMSRYNEAELVTFTVQLYFKLSEFQSCNQSTYNLSLTIDYKNPVAVPSYTSTPCAGTVIDFYDNSLNISSNTYQRIWEFSNGVKINNNTGKYRLKDSPIGTNFATLTVVDEFGCSNESVTYFEFDNNPRKIYKEYFIYNESKNKRIDEVDNCSDDTYSLIIGISSHTLIDKFVWSMLPERESHEVIPPYNFSKGGLTNNYTITLGKIQQITKQMVLSTTFEYDCNVVTDNFSTTIDYSQLVADIKTKSICLVRGIELSFDVVNSNPYTHSWKLNTGIRSSDPNFIVDNLPQGTYEYELILTDTKNCVEIKTSTFDLGRKNIKKTIALYNNSSKSYKPNSIYCANESISVILKVQKGIVVDNMTITTQSGNNVPITRNIFSPVIWSTDTTDNYFNLEIPNNTWDKNKSTIITVSLNYDCNDFIDKIALTIFYDKPEAMPFTVTECLGTVLLFSDMSSSVSNIISRTWISQSGFNIDSRTFRISSGKSGKYLATLTIINANQCSDSNPFNYVFDNSTDHITNTLLLYNEDENKFYPFNQFCYEPNTSVVFGISKAIGIKDLRWSIEPNGQVTKKFQSTIWQASNDINYYKDLIPKEKIISGLNTVVVNFGYICNPLKEELSEEFEVNIINPKINIDNSVCNGIIAQLSDSSQNPNNIPLTTNWEVMPGLISQTVSKGIINLLSSRNGINLVTMTFTDNFGCKFHSNTSFNYIDANTRKNSLSVNLINLKDGTIINNNNTAIVCFNKEYETEISSILPITTLTIYYGNTLKSQTFENLTVTTINPNKYTYKIPFDTDKLVTGANIITYSVVNDCLFPAIPINITVRKNNIEVIPTIIEKPCQTNVITIVNNSKLTGNSQNVVWSLKDTIINNPNSIAINSTAVGLYTGILTVEDDAGCRQSKKFEYVIKDFTNLMSERKVYAFDNTVSNQISTLCLPTNNDIQIYFEVPFIVDELRWEFLNKNNITTVKNPSYAYYDTSKQKYLYAYPNQNNLANPNNSGEVIFTVTYNRLTKVACINQSETHSGKYVHSHIDTKLEISYYDCEAEKIVIKDKSIVVQGIKTRVWSIDNGDSHNGEKFVIPYSSNYSVGNHTFVFELLDNVGCRVQTESIFTVSKNKEFSFALNNIEEECLQKDLTANVLPHCRLDKNISTIQYNWFLDGASVTNNTSKVIIDYTNVSVGTHTLKLDIILNSIELYTYAIKFFIKGRLVSDFKVSPSDPNYCNNSTVTFQNNSFSDIPITKVEFDIKEKTKSILHISDNSPYFNGKLRDYSQFFPRRPFYNDILYNMSQTIYSGNCSSTTSKNLTLHNVPKLTVLQEKISFCNTDKEMKDMVKGYVEVDKTTGFWEIKINNLNFSKKILPTNYVYGNYVLKYIYHDLHCPISTEDLNLTIKRSPEVNIIENTFYQTFLERIEMDIVYPQDRRYTLYWSNNVYVSERLEVSPMVIINDNEIYTVTIVADNGCSLDIVRKVREYNKPLQNFVTPDDDNQYNDVLDYTDILEYFPDAELIVYTRSGQEVIRNSELVWDTKLNGKEVPAGIYYYQIFLRNRKAEVISGFIYILRE